MRLFAAVIPPDEVVEDLDAFLAPRREAGPFRWTLPEQWHLTLAFMPDVEERRLDDLVERLARAANRRTAFANYLRTHPAATMPVIGGKGCLFSCSQGRPVLPVDQPR